MITPMPKPPTRPCKACTSLECGPLRCRFADPSRPRCENHEERDGLLTVHLPSLGIERFMCVECRAAFALAMPKSPRATAREGWSGDEMFAGGYMGRTSSRWENPNSYYERRRDAGNRDHGGRDE